MKNLILTVLVFCIVLFGCTTDKVAPVEKDGLIELGMSLTKYMTPTSVSNLRTVPDDYLFPQLIVNVQTKVWYYDETEGGGPSILPITDYNTTPGNTDYTPLPAGVAPVNVLFDPTDLNYVTYPVYSDNVFDFIQLNDPTTGAEQGLIFSSTFNGIISFTDPSIPMDPTTNQCLIIVDTEDHRDNTSIDQSSIGTGGQPYIEQTYSDASTRVATDMVDIDNVTAGPYAGQLVLYDVADYTDQTDMYVWYPFASDAKITDASPGGNVASVPKASTSISCTFMCNDGIERTCVITNPLKGKRYVIKADVAGIQTNLPLVFNFLNIFGAPTDIPVTGGNG